MGSAFFIIKNVIFPLFYSHYFIYNKNTMIYDFQKASFLKRISSFLLDFILVTIVGCFIAFIISLISNYTGIRNEFYGYMDHYEALYGLNLRDAAVIETYTAEQQETVKQAYEAMNADQGLLKCYGLLTNLPVVMVSVGLLVGTLVVEFVMPIIFKNGQTIGKKVFKIGVINTNGVECTNFQLLTRALLGKCAVEYMIPGIITVMMCLGTMGIIGPIVLLFLLVMQCVVIASNQNRPFFHDLIAKTGVCDLSTQKVFKTYEEMVKFKEEINKQKVEASIY